MSLLRDIVKESIGEFQPTLTRLDRPPTLSFVPCTFPLTWGASPKKTLGIQVSTPECLVQENSPMSDALRSKKDSIIKILVSWRSVAASLSGVKDVGDKDILLFLLFFEL